MAATLRSADRTAFEAEPDRPPVGSRLVDLVERLCAPVDGASLVVFRVMFGAIMLWEVWRYFRNGWIRLHFIDPTFHFTYFGFEWVRPWPGAWMYLHFWILGVLAVCIIVGAMYRLAATLFFVGITHVFLIDQATYLNHMYLVSVVSFLMIVVPCHRAWSVDAWSWPAWRSDTAPRWAVWLLRFQIGVPYFYGGIAKINADWLQGEPVRMWLAQRATRSVIAPLLTSEWTVFFISYGGLLFDLLVVPFLLCRRTRLLAYGAALAFHLTNWYLFNIGIFPWFMMAATLLFFDPAWPRQVARRIWALVHPLLPSRLAARPLPDLQPLSELPARRRPGRVELAVLAMLGLHVVIQMVVPFRHHLYPGDVAWTEEGHRFSWRMKLRDKHHITTYTAYVPSTGAMWEVNPRDYLRPWQVSEMYGRPDMILQLAHLMADDLRRQGYADVQIHVRSLTSLNGRRRQDLIDTTIDLASRQRTIWPADWLLPLTEPLRPTRQTAPAPAAAPVPVQTPSP